MAEAMIARDMAGAMSAVTAEELVPPGLKSHPSHGGNRPIPGARSPLRRSFALPPLHARQQEVANHPARFKILAMGRRWGKTKLCAVLAVARAIKRGHVWWIAPDYKRAEIGWKELKRLAVQIPGARVNEADKLIELPTNGWIQVRSADNPQSLRGEGLDLVIIDECAFVAEAAWVEAVQPALADREGSAVLISTPFGRNWFYRAWHYAKTADDADWAAWQLPSWTNPFLNPKEIMRFRRTYPDRAFRQEFGAEFLDDAGGVFRHIRACATSSGQDTPISGHQYAMGLDWGLEHDFTVAAIVDVTLRELVALDRFNQIDWQIQYGRVRALHERFRPGVVVAEANSIGMPNISALSRPYITDGQWMPGLEIVPFQTSAQSKKLVVDNMSLLFERRAWRIIPHPVLIAELEAFQETRLPSGLVRYAAPEGMHDDTVIAALLASAVLMDAVPAEETIVDDDRIEISPY